MAALSSANMKYTAEELAKVSGISAETMANWGLTQSTDTLTMSQLAELASSDAQAKKVLEKIIAQNAQKVANGEITASNISLAASEGTATLATGSFTTAIKANISAMWTWMKTTPLGWLTLLAAGVFVAVKAYDIFTTSVEEQREAMENSVSAYEEAQTALSNTTTELENQEQAMDDLLAKEKLTYAEKGQLEELKQITAELRIQKDLNEKNVDKTKREAAVDASKLFKKQFGDYEISESKIDEYEYNADLMGNNAILISEEDDISAMLAGYRQFMELRKQAYEEGDQYNIDHFTGLTDDIKENIFETAQELQTQKDAISDYYETLKNTPYDSLTSEQKEVVDSYNSISNAIALIYKQLDPQTWNSMQLTDVFAVEGAEKSKEELIEMAKAGTLDEKTIQSYTNLNKALESSGLVLEDGKTAAGAFCDEIYAMAGATETAGENILALKAKLSEYKQALADEYQKATDWGLDSYLDDIKNGTIQSTFGNVDMDKRTIITWSEELKKTYQDALASWEYDPEVGSIDTVFGSSDRFGENLNGAGWEVAFTPILPDGTFLSKDTVYEYINNILAEAYGNDNQVTEEELKSIDAQGRQIGQTFVKGIFAGVDDSQNYDNNGNWAETVGRLMHFSGDFGAVEIAQKGIADTSKAIEEATKNANKMTVSLEDLTKELDKLQDIYKTVSSAISEFNDTGYFSVDAFQSLMELDAKYIPMLIDEQGNLTLTKEALNELTAARMEEMAIKQAQSLIDNVAALNSEEEQLKFLKGQVDDTTNSFKEFAEAQALVLLTSGKISANVYNELVSKLQTIGTVLENSKQGLKNGGWDSTNLSNAKKKVEKAKELAEKEKEIAEDLAEKEKEIAEDLAEKEKEFAKNMAEAMKKEHLEQLKDRLEKEKDLIDRFHKAVELTDFAIDYIDENNFQLKSDLLAGKMENLTSYGKSMREEFDRICQIIPQTGEEAEALANRIEQLGSDMRSNISDIRETQVAIQMLRIDAFKSIADNSMDELENELDKINKRLELLNADNKNDYQYTNQLLSMNSLLPVYSDFNKTRKEKSKQDKQKIEDEQKTQDKINEVVSNALKMQAEDNAKAREEERQKLIEDMEKARSDAMKKLEEARADAKKKLQEARKDYQDFLDGIKNDTTATFNKMGEDVESRKWKLQPIDTTEFLKSIEDAQNKLKAFSSNSLYKGINDKGYMNPLSNGKISSTFGLRASPGNGGSSNHKGLDIAAPSGTIISAIKGGEVKTSGYLSGYGNTVVVVTPDGMEITYAHMLEPSSLKVGDKISIGDTIGKVGSTGNSTGSHLHLGLKKMGVWVDPKDYIPGYAKGTKFHPGGLALLGDENLLNSANKVAPETVIYPNGSVEVVGENGAELRDLPRGTEVLNNTDTKKLFNNIPRYEDGTSQFQKLIDSRKETQTPVPVTVEGKVAVEDNNNSTLIETAKEKELADIDFMADEFSTQIGRMTVETRLRQQEIIDNTTISDEDKQKALVNLAIDKKNGAGEFAVQYGQKVKQWFTNYLESIKENPELYSEEIISEYEGLLSDITDWIYDIENDIVEKKQKLVESAQNEISAINDYIEDRDFYNDWSLWDDTKEDAMVRQINKWKELLENGYISVEEYNKQVQNIEKNLYTIKKDKLIEALELNQSKMKSLQSITQKYFDTTNEITRAQHDITNELKASKTMTEYLDEETRKLLFNQEDYNKLTERLTDIQRDANLLQKEFNKKIRHASAEEMDALTSEYEMQYDILMKKYEISKADLEIEKKRMQLNNVLNERNVRMRINGRWEYVANTQDVISAQNELNEAEYQKTQAQTSLSQTREINNMTAAQNATTTIINKVNNGLINYEEDVSKFKDSIKELYTKSTPAFGTAISNCCASLEQFERSLRGIESPISTSDSYDYSKGAQNGVSSVGLKSNQLNYTMEDRDVKANKVHYILPYDKSVDYSALIDSAETLDEALNYNNYRNSKIRDAQSEDSYKNEKEWDSNYVKDRWLASHPNKYAKGTRKTHTETALMGEDGYETFISSNGHLIPINQPIFGNIEAGGIVFNRDQMDFTRKIWDWSNVGTLPTSSISNFVNRNSGETVNYNMYGDAILNGDDPKAIFKQLADFMQHNKYKSC